jgi:hypothetical protein
VIFSERGLASVQDATNIHVMRRCVVDNLEAIMKKKDKKEDLLSKVQMLTRLRGKLNLSFRAAAIAYASGRTKE